MSGPTLTFIVPVRHQDNARDWDALKANLSQTVASIAAQTSDDWRGVVVANEGADLPPMPAGFAVERVTFPPNDVHERGDATRDDFLNAFRIDKGQRALAGMLTQPDSDFFMIVDDDDFVSNRLTEYVGAKKPGNGWAIRHGYVWNDGGNYLYAHDDYNHVCGSSLIVSSALYDLPERAEDVPRSFVMQMLGSHHGIEKLMDDRGTPLNILPFRGGVYRVAHAGSHSQTPGFLRKYILSGDWYRYPRTTLRKLLRVSKITSAQDREFFGAR